MKISRLFLAILILGVFWLGAAVGRQDPLWFEGGPASLDEYGFVARGRLSPSRGVNPAEIARMDTNGKILMACLEPKNIEQLRSSGIEFVRSQLELLTDWDLLKYDRANKTYSTAIHVYGPRKASAIRELALAGAARLAAALDADLAELRGHLEKIGRGKSLFSVLYAYVLHGYAMDQFAEVIYQKPQLSAEHPFWNGFAWAIFPAREFSLNPLHLPAENVHFYILGGEPVSGPSFRQWLSLVKDGAVDLRIDDLNLRKEFSAFGIADKEGNLTIPVFEGERSARLESMAGKFYSETRTIAASTEMKKILGMDTQAQAEMFVHYELRYAILSRLLDAGVVAAPLDFDNRANNRPADVGNLVFLIKAGSAERLPSALALPN